MAPGLVDTSTNTDVHLPHSPAAVKQHSFADNADSEEYARALDASDPLRRFREKFIVPSKTKLKTKTLAKTDGVFSFFFPLLTLSLSLCFPGRNFYLLLDALNQADAATAAESEDGIYFCGNSLGLQPKCMAQYIQAQLDTWASIGVAGHFTQLDESPLRPWQSMADFAAEQSSRLVGALPGEVAVENTLSVNLHLLMASFYRPTAQRNKILLEWKAFPSDHVCSVQHHLLPFPVLLVATSWTKECLHSGYLYLTSRREISMRSNPRSPGTGTTPRRR